jgi:hypothetical protein
VYSLLEGRQGIVYVGFQRGHYMSLLQHEEMKGSLVNKLKGPKKVFLQFEGTLLLRVVIR